MITKRREILLTVLTLTVLALLAANSLVFYRRWDLTEHKAFTISEVSKNLFREIPDQVDITYYVSEKLSRLSPIPLQVEDLLREYAAHGRGKIRVTLKDPAKGGDDFRPEETGVIPQQIQVVERNEQTVATVYTGIVISYLDSREVLPVVYDLTTLEYELTRKIKKVVKGEVPSLGVLSGRGGLSSEFQLLANRLSRSYQVRELRRGEPIPQDLSVLFVLGARDLDEFDLYGVDQYLMRGGKALFAADGVHVDLDRNLQATPEGDLPLFGLLAAYGVEVHRDLVLDLLCRRIPVQRNSGQVVLQSLERYNHWVAVQGQGFSRESPVTARLSGLDLYWPSSLGIKERPEAKAEILASSGTDSWLMRERFVTNPYEAPSYRSLAAESLGRYPLAVSLRGSFESYFKGRSVPERTGERPPGGEKIEVSRETRIIVLGDSDAATDLMQYSDGLYNLVFFENAADWLAGEDDLLDIRTRSARDMRLSRIDDPGTRNTLLLFARVVNVFLLPFGVIVFGVLRALRRRERFGDAGEGGSP